MDKYLYSIDDVVSATGLSRATINRLLTSGELIGVKVGRRRMIRPLYEALVARGGTWLVLAKQTYARAKPLYHPIVRDAIEKLIGT